MYIDKDDKRINPHARLVRGNVTYVGNILRFPEAVAALGIREIPDPAPPEDFDDRNYFVSHSDTAPYTTYTKKAPEQLREVAIAAMPALTPLQMRKALKAKNLRTAIKNAIKTDEELSDLWECAREFHRDGRFVLRLGELTGASEAQLDSLFVIPADEGKT